MKQRIEWLAVLRGLNILLVVMVHVQLIDISTGTNHLFCKLMTFPFHPVRMPLFIFVSGGLLYLSRIKKNVSVADLYKDKFQRIMIPFFFFVLVYFIIKALFNEFTKSPMEISWSYFFQSFIYYRGGYPSEPLWYLAVLMFLMLMYPLYCYLCNSKWKMLSFFLFCCATYFIDTDLNSTWNVCYILELQHYLVYFFFGIFFFRYELYQYITKDTFVVGLIIAYGLLYHYNISLITSLEGIIMMCAVCMKVAHYIPSLFSSFREYIFQIYLMSMPFQVFVELILWKHLFYNEQWFYLFYVLNVSFGLIIPVIISKVVEHCPVRIIRFCFGLT